MPSTLARELIVEGLKPKPRTFHVMDEADIDAALGRAIRRRRTLLGMTQAELASATSVRFQQIQKYETAANRMSAARLWTIARALGCTPADLYPKDTGK